MSTTTTDEIRRRIQLVQDETSDALKQYAAIGEARRKVAELQHQVTNGATDAECDAAAPKLVKASEDLRLAELVEPRKKAASDAARARRTDAAVSAIQSVMRHFEALNNEAREVAYKVVLALPSPLAMEVRLEEGGYHRNMVLGQMLDLMPGVFDSGQAYRRAYDCRNSRECAESNASAMLETFDAETATVRAQIDKLNQVLSALGLRSGETASTGEVIHSLPGATADEAEELATA
jgi:hypothetical protein